MDFSPTAAALPGIVAELGRVRVHGLLDLRTLELPVLHAASALHGANSPDRAGEIGPGDVEALLREAVGTLGGGNLQTAAAYTFGLTQGAREWAAQDRRRRAAEVFRVSTDRFRKHHEKLVLAETAEAVLRLCAARRSADGGGTGAGSGAGNVNVNGAVRAASGSEQAGPPLGPLPLDLVLGGTKARITVHTGPIEFVTGVDILVSSENTYLEMSRTFRQTTSGALRRAAARQNAAGGILDDVLARELHDWLVRFAAPGLPVAPGTVVATSAGELATQGVRRIYHAATVTPRTDGGYDTTPAVVTKAVRQVFEEAAAERDGFAPPLASVCLPVLGAGRGGLAPAASLRAMLAAIGPALAERPFWDVHLAVRRPEVSRVVLDVLAEYGQQGPPS
ncbi:macro domain-containing protein [Streptomyces sp. NPDC012746]|uniref:macro domain-containing protein n=1 Tax=Streptomyces sp. NPDC012746 TaxID=3364845 RepID=UPI0036C3FE28